MNMNNYNPFSLQGKTILITGASSGLGKATAIECAKLGATLIITGRNAERLNEVYNSLEGEGHLQQALDLTDVSLLEEFVINLPVLDGCVNNAGIGNKQPIAFIKRSDLQAILDINTFAPVMLTQLLVKKKKLKRGSSMVLTSSISGVYSVDIGNTLYSITKSAIDGFMKNAAIELAIKGIRVNSVNPGMIDTPMNDGYTEEQRQKDLADYPLQRYGTPNDVAWGIIYLLSDAAAWVTGASLKIDGGYTLR
jgi:NAD(P)-dependent dehydrogenase (short-subunit alcohol dehydrogenase family)